MANSENINTLIGESLKSLRNDTTLNVQIFSEMTAKLYESIVNHSIGEINSDNIEKVKLLSTKISILITQKKLPTLIECQSWKCCIDIFYGKVLFENNVRGFLLFYSRLEILAILDQLSNVNQPDDYQALLCSLSAKLNKNTLLSFQGKQLAQFKNLLSKHLSTLSSSARTKTEYRQLSHLVEHKIKPALGFDSVLIDQEIWIELNTLSTSFERQPISIASLPTQNQTEACRFQGLMLTNYHIQDLKLELKTYGFDGQLQFQLGYDKDAFHPDYLFLYQNQPLSVRVLIKQVYTFPDPEAESEEENNYETELELFAVANLEPRSHLTMSSVIANIDPVDQSAEVASANPEFTLNFSDPINLWKYHRPNYLTANQSYGQIFEDNLFFQSLASIDSQQSTKLSKVFEQISVFTHSRNFHDFFSEALEHYQQYLIYDYANSAEQGLSNYILLDQLSDTYSGSPEKEVKLDGADLMQVDDIQIHLANTWSHEASYVNASLDQSGSTEITAEQPAFLGLKSQTLDFETDSQLMTNWYQNANNQSTLLASVSGRYQVNTKDLMPHLPTYPSYFSYPLESEHWQSTLSNFSQGIQSRSVSIDFSQTLATKQYVLNKVKAISWESEEDNDRYEKVRAIEMVEGITHFTNVAYHWHDQASTVNDLPSYTPFVSIDIPAQVVTAETVDDSVLYGYKFFKGKSTTESSLADDSQAQSADYSRANESENALTYAVKFAPSLFVTDSETPLFYVSAANELYTPSSFKPLRNGDRVLVTLNNPEKMTISQTVGTSVEFQDKASELMVQSSKFGAQQECEITCSDNSDEQRFQFSQTNRDNAGSNSISLSNNNGLLFAFSDEQEENQ